MSTSIDLGKRKLIGVVTGILILNTLLVKNSLVWAKENHHRNAFKLTRLVSALRSINSIVCSNVAAELEKIPLKQTMYNLILRRASIGLSDASLLAAAIQETHQIYKLKLNTFSVSYNTKLTEKGFHILLKSLPDDVREFGAVGCGLNDNGGRDILNFIKRSENLRLICIEGNYFSEPMKSRIKGSVDNILNCTLVI